MRLSLPNIFWPAYYALLVAAVTWLFFTELIYRADYLPDLHIILLDGAGTIQGATFDHPTTLVLRGGPWTVTDCTWRGNFPYRAPALHATLAQRLTLQRCTFALVQQGIVIEDTPLPNASEEGPVQTRPLPPPSPRPIPPMNHD